MSTTQTPSTVSDAEDAAVHFDSTQDLRRRLAVRTGVAVFVLCGKGAFLLGQRLGVGPLALKWGVPGGGIEWGETIEQAALRELREETGLTGEYLGQIGSYTYHLVDPVQDLDEFFITTYVAVRVHNQNTQTIASTEPEKHGDWEWFSLGLPIPVPLAFPCTEEARVELDQRIMKLKTSPFFAGSKRNDSG